jgi:phage shock protein PspC (stress-responsive transcriptional regulator)
MDTKKLYRYLKQGWIGGVCVGLGENLVVDPAVVRLIFVLLFFARIYGILIYLILWHLIAVAPE